MLNKVLTETWRAPVPRRRGKRLRRRLASVKHWTDGHLLDPAKIVDALQNLLAPGDRVALEGNNQKQTDSLSRALARMDPAKIHDLHLLISSISRAEHLDLFQKGNRPSSG
jgi:malonate decarboxylase alpha subunit